MTSFKGGEKKTNASLESVMGSFKLFCHWHHSNVSPCFSCSFHWSGLWLNPERLWSHPLAECHTVGGVSLGYPQVAWVNDCYKPFCVLTTPERHPVILLATWRFVSFPSSYGLSEHPLKSSDLSSCDETSPDTDQAWSGRSHLFKATIRSLPCKNFGGLVTKKAHKTFQTLPRGFLELQESNWCLMATVSATSCC